MADAKVTTIRVTGWDKWQSYRRDRGAPPWIKVYRNLMSNAEWASLTDSEKGQLVSIWLIAADKGGKIPGDANILRKVCQLDNPPNINKFIELGFLSSEMTTRRRHVDAKVTTRRRHVDAPETETETDIEETNAIALSKKPSEGLELPNNLDRRTDGKNGKRLSGDWWLDEKDRAFAIKLGIDDPGFTSEQFRDHWTAKAGKDATALDWHAKWRTWCRNEVKWTAERMANRPKSTGVVAGALAELAEI